MERDLRILDNIKEERTSRLENIPQNTCAYSTSLDFVRGMQWLSSIKASYQDLPYVGACLRKRKPNGRSTQYRKAIEEIISWNEGSQGPLQQIEDPWIIIHKIKTKLYNYAEETIDPLLTLQCGHKVIGDCDMLRTDRRKKFEMAKINCGECGIQSTPKVQQLPEEFCIRLLYDKFSIFDEVQLPRFNKYRIKSVIQVNEEKSHFRMIKNNYNTVITIDGMEVEVKKQEQWESVLEEDGWNNYIISYILITKRDEKSELYNQLKVSKETNGNPWRIIPNRHFVGGMTGKETVKGKIQSYLAQTRKQERKEQIQELRTDIIAAGIDKMIGEKLNKIEEEIQHLKREYKNLKQENEELYEVVGKLISKTDDIGQQDRIDLKSMKSQEEKCEKNEEQAQIQERKNENLIKSEKKSVGWAKSERKIYETPKESANNRKNGKVISNAKRKERLGRLLENGCAWNSVLDLLEGNPWLRCTETERTEQNCEVISVLKGNPASSFEAAAQQIHSFATADNRSLKVPGEQKEDPWIILRDLMEMMNNKKVMGINHNPIMPVMECDCGKQRRTRIAANIEFIKERGANKFENKVLQCEACGTSGKTVFTYLPNNFFVKLTDNSVKSIFNSTILPRIEKYYPNALIQYKDGHFRTLKLLGYTTTTILDGINITQLQGEEERKRVLNDQQWQNYIVSYSIVSRYQQQNNYHEEIANLEMLERDKLEREKVGGSITSNHSNTARTRIILWNVQGYGSREAWYAKMKIIRSLRPLIFGVNESYSGKISMRQYQSFAAKPAITRNRIEKLNATLVLHESIQAKIISQEVNYVSVLCDDYPFRIPTMIACIYLYPSTSRMDEVDDDALQHAYQDLIRLRYEHPQHNYIIMGDFNMIQSQINKHRHPLFESIKQLSRYETTQPRSRNGGNRSIDYIYTNMQASPFDIDRQYIEAVKQLSDHDVVTAQVEVQGSIKITQLPNKKYNSKLTKMLIDKCNGPLGDRPLSQIMDECRIELKHEKKRKVLKKTPFYFQQPDKLPDIQSKGKRIIEIFRNANQKFINQIISKRFSKQSKIAFENLKKFTQYHLFQKRDGQIMWRARFQGELVQGQRLDQLIMADFQKLHRHQNNAFQEEIDFPDLKLSDTQIVNICRNVKPNKASNFDGISSELFKLCNGDKCNGLQCKNCRNKITVLRKFLTKQYWHSQQSQRHTKARLICLNKKYPSLPAISDYRPLIVSSYVIRFLQGILMPKLRSYAETQMNKAQFGFRPHSGIDICKEKVMEKLFQRSKIGKSTFGMFFDFSQAYDRVTRWKLYDKVRQRKIFSKQEMTLLRFIHKKTTVELNKEEICMEDGIPQGYSTSPVLFDIYSQDLITLIEEAGGQIFAYADDLLVLSNNLRDARKMIKLVKKWALENNMKLNEKKSAIVQFTKARKNHIYNEDFQEVEGIPVVKEYRYLGMNLSYDLNIKSHVNTIQRKITYLNYKTYPIRKEANPKFTVNLFKILVLPLFSLGLSMYRYLSKSQQEELMKCLKKHLKQFLGLPKSTPDVILTEFLDLNDFIQSSLTSTRQRSAEYFGLQQNQPPHPRQNSTAVMSAPPPIVILAIRVLYSSTCRMHRHILSASHLEAEHGCRFRLLTEVRRSKVKTNMNSAISNIKKIISLAKTIE